MRVDIQLIAEDIRSFRGVDAVETQGLVQRTLEGGSHVSTTWNYVGVPAFRLGRQVLKITDDRFHFRHEL